MSVDVVEYVPNESDLVRISEMADRIDLCDSSLCVTYGTVGQKKLAEVSDKLLGLVRSDASLDATEKIKELSDELRRSTDIKQPRGIFGFFKRKRSMKQLRQRCEAAADKIERIAAELKEHRNRLLRDHVMLGKLYEATEAQHRDLTLIVEAGQRKLEGDTTLDKDSRERFEKRLYDLKLSRTVSLQTMTQIKIIRNCGDMLSERIQSLLTNTLTLWKEQLALNMALKNTANALEGMRGANDRMIDAFGDVTAAKDDMAKESERLKELIGKEGDCK